MKKLLILPLLALVLVGCDKAEKQEAATLPAVPVRLIVLGDGASDGWIATTLSATQRATLSTRMAAAVKKVWVNEGQKVAEGTLLVSLGDEDLQGGLKAAEAGVAAAEAQNRRIQNLMKQGASMSAEEDMAKTQLAQAQAGLAQVKANIAFTQIRAPFSGVVQARRVNEGDFVGPGAPLVELEGQGALELVGSVSEAEAMGLKLGQKLSFEAEGQRGEVTLTGLSTGGDPVSHRGTLRARISKSNSVLRTGTFARIQLPGKAKASGQLLIPRSALVQRGELNGVFVAKEGKAELRWLSLGEAQGDQFPVRAGLSKGETVIDQPGTLKDGQPIEVKK